ncbi:MULTISPECIES: thioesterase family protein [Streptomyces]|uniref:thioesterase family protein n=3 Tax=Streptomyces TaxID=1883 RepID=UPI002F955F3E
MAFYERIDGERFLATEDTRGPWDAGAQHAGPPAALLGRAVERRAGARPDMRIARITFDILRPVPLGVVSVRVRELRLGRSTEVVEAELEPAGAGQPAVVARALRVRVAGDGLVPAVAEGPRLPPPGSLAQSPFYAVPWERGYHTAMEMRFAEGGFTEPGPGACWMRMRVPLVEGEPVGALDRVLVAADSGNGISAAVDFGRYVFVNSDLTVHLHRHPAGEWVGVQARTSVDPAGIGLADSVLHDEKGPLGRGAQSLFVAPRA